MLGEGKRSYRGFPQGIVIPNEVRNLLFLWLRKEQIPPLRRAQGRNDKGPPEIRGKIFLIVQTHFVLLLASQRHQRIQACSAPSRQMKPGAVSSGQRASQSGL
jgi:hypothetical protein